MPTLYDLRIEAGLSVTELAEQVHVDRNTVYKAERGEAIRDAVAGKIVRFLSKQLDRPLTIRDVDGLQVITPKRIESSKQGVKHAAH